LSCFNGVFSPFSTLINDVSSNLDDVLAIASDDGLNNNEAPKKPRIAYIVPSIRNIPGTRPTTGLVIGSYNPDIGSTG